MNQIIELARLCGWMVYHTRPARTARGWRTPIQGNKGFPDLVLVKDKVIYAELKAEKGLWSEDQAEWAKALEAAGQEYHLWRPRNWPEIERELREGVL